jgi:hypothetical protein
MELYAFCPNSKCKWHLAAPEEQWYSSAGHHDTLAFGRVPRFKCHSCGKTFSTQTFSIDYWAKRTLDYPAFLLQQSSSESIRALSRSFRVSCGTILNKVDRLSRQALALHARVRKLARKGEAVCVDGFVSFDVSQFFPNEITLSITSSSRFALELVHATRKRSGTMTNNQKARASSLNEERLLVRFGKHSIRSRRSERQRPEVPSSS